MLNRIVKLDKKCEGIKIQSQYILEDLSHEIIIGSGEYMVGILVEDRDLGGFVSELENLLTELKK